MKQRAPADRLGELLAEVQAHLAAEQPELTAHVHKDMVVVEGKLLVGQPSAWFDVYDVLIAFTVEFPEAEPAVWEVASRIPRTADRHVFPKGGNCCLGIWEEWLVEAPAHGVADFMRGPLQSYFEGQTHFEVHGEWPYGERPHGASGVFEAYADVLGLPHEPATIRAHLNALTKRELKGHHACPCGSGRRLRDCHAEGLRAMSAKVDADMARRMLAGLPND